MELSRGPRPTWANVGAEPRDNLKSTEKTETERRGWTDRVADPQVADDPVVEDQVGPVSDR